MNFQRILVCLSAAPTGKTWHIGWEELSSTRSQGAAYTIVQNVKILASRSASHDADTASATTASQHNHQKRTRAAADVVGTPPTASRPTQPRREYSGTARRRIDPDDLSGARLEPTQRGAQQAIAPTVTTPKRTMPRSTSNPQSKRPCSQPPTSPRSTNTQHRNIAYIQTTAPRSGIGGRQYQVGIKVNWDFNPTRLLITKVASRSPAANAGLTTKDRITRINDTDITSYLQVTGPTTARTTMLDWAYKQFDHNAIVRLRVTRQND